MHTIDVEFHCHTYHSEDSLMRPGRLLQVCRRRGIDRLAITDHNQIAGGRAAARLDSTRAIIGEEILTTRGELLAYYVKERVPAGLSPEEAVARLRAQGAFISVSHPFDSVRQGAWCEDDLMAIADQVDAVEFFNARCWSADANRRAAEFARNLGLLGTAGSDAHAYAEVGRVVMRMPPFEDAASLRRALAHAKVIGRRSSPLVHLYSRYASLCKALGWRPPGGSRL